MSTHEDIVYGRSGDGLRVFVASEMRSGRYAATRPAVATAVEETGFHFAWFWERDGVSGSPSVRDVCVPTAGTSDLLVLLLGPELTDLTRDEYHAAKAKGAGLVIMTDSGCARDELTEKFLSDEAAHAIIVTFSSTTELCTRMHTALKTLMLRATRERQAIRLGAEPTLKQITLRSPGYGDFL